MATYFVTPPEATPWHLDQEAFEAALRQQWPGVALRRDPDPAINYPLTWTLPGAHGPLEGSLDRDGQAVSLDGDLADAAPFAVWLRGLVPSEQALLFYDESYSASVPLADQTLPEEITSAFG